MAETTFRRAVTQALEEEMARDETVFIIGEDVGAAGGTFALTRGLYDRFGEWRVRDTPISEEGIMGLAVGAAMAGYRPVVEIMFMDFITIAMEQLINQAAKARYLHGGQVGVPLVVRTLAGAGLRAGGHHSQSLEALFTHVPGLKVVFPATPHDAKGLLKAAIRDPDPVIFIEHKSLLRIKGEVPGGDYTVPIGQAEVRRAGQQATLVATGWMVHSALAAAGKLSGKGIEVEVIDPRTLSPLDKDCILTSVKKTGRLVVVHEAVKPCGFGAEVAAVVAEEALDYLEAPVKRVTMPFVPVPSGSAEDYLIPAEDDIVQAVEELMA